MPRTIPQHTALVSKIQAFNATRLPHMVAYKYSFMAENIFRFYRGTCHLFYEQLSQTKLSIRSPHTWICGDLHLENFGSYKGNNRLVYFDLNDFDEAILAPAHWEIVRLLTSIIIAFQTLGIDELQAINMVQLFLKSYSQTLQKGKALYIEPQTATGIVCSFLEKASQRKQKDILKKYTVDNNKLLKIDKKRSKYFKLDSDLDTELRLVITRWLANNHDGPYNYEVLDTAFRLAGTGSVGVKRYAILLRSINDNGKKHLLLDMKEATPSALAPCVKIKQPRWINEAERIVSIQQRMQNVPPALLSTTVFRDQAFVIQEMQPEKNSIDFTLIKDRYRDIYKVIDDMAILTASAQLRSSGRQGSAIADDLIAFGFRTDWQPRLADLAHTCAKNVARDYKAYVKEFNKTTVKKASSLRKQDPKS
jgi:uncharacterized protein (DUF2252 family)